MGDELSKAQLDEQKVRTAQKALKEREKESVFDDRKRKYNSMVADTTTAEEMEAYHRNKARSEDPMANFIAEDEVDTE